MLCAVLLGGALSTHANFGSGLTDQQAKELEEARRRMESKPYQPSNAPGCQRWRGRALLAVSGITTPCSSGCALEETDWGRYEFTGARCSASSRVVATPPAAAVTTTPVAAPGEPERPVLPRYQRPEPLPGKAVNHGPGQWVIEGPPPGFRATQKN